MADLPPPIPSMPILSVSTRDQELAHEVAAIFANKFIVNVGPAGVRIAFGEQFSPDQEPRFRTAIALAMQDAIQLANLLKAMLAEPEKALQKFLAEQSQTPAQENG